MNERELKRWLNAADVSAAEPSIGQLDAMRLRQLVIRRRIKRRWFATAAVAGMLFAVTALTARPTRVDVTTARAKKLTAPLERAAASEAMNVQSLRERLHRLDAKIKEHKALVAALRQAEKLQRLNAQIADLEAAKPSATALLSIRSEQLHNQAAAISLFYADLLATEFEEHDRADAEYSIIISRYPGTAWSAAAERSLLSAERNL